MSEIIGLVEIFDLILSGSVNRAAQHQAICLRKTAFAQIFQPIVKVAFDTRRVNQETQYIARRGLQNYHRSQDFMDQNTADKLENIGRIKEALDSLNEEYGKEIGWLDSYCRVLSGSVNNALRENIKDGDFTQHQPGMASFNYLEEILHLRYRIVLAEVGKMSLSEIKTALLAKDPELKFKGNHQNHIVKINKSDINENYDTLLNKLFGDIRASQEQPVVERTITITIKDSLPGIAKKSDIDQE